MKCLPGLSLLLSMMLLSPSLSWSEETAGGSNGEATTEQAGGADGQTSQGGSGASEEPDCE